VGSFTLFPRLGYGRRAGENIGDKPSPGRLLLSGMHALLVAVTLCRHLGAVTAQAEAACTISGIVASMGGICLVGLVEALPFILELQQRRRGVKPT